MNDTVGTLAACSLEDKRCAVGLIVGTGSNAAYLEDIDKVELITARRLSGELNEEDVAHATSVVINMEWGAFGDYGELDYYRTEFDEILDKESIVPGKQKYAPFSSVFSFLCLQRGLSRVYFVFEGLRRCVQECILVKSCGLFCWTLSKRVFSFRAKFLSVYGIKTASILNISLKLKGWLRFGNYSVFSFTGNRLSICAISCALFSEIHRIFSIAPYTC